LKLFDFPKEVQEQIDLLIKLVYFEDDQIMPIEIRDLVGAGGNQSRSSSNNPLGNLGGLE